MKSINQKTYLLAALMCVYAVPVIAQDEETATLSEAEAKASENTEVSRQEVEVNEDNYRQFMELKDTGLQRNVFPETAYKSQAQLQKLDKLPEESQKHLRNQLREIIVQGDPWKPGDEDTDYPYTASAAAIKNPSLQKQEAEAWGELVDNYHQREAQIYANSARSAAAAAPGSASGEGSGNNGASAGNGAQQGGEGQQASQENSSRQNAAAGSYSPGASSRKEVKNAEGVSQNAMEFLKSQSGTNPGQGADTQNSQTPAGSNKQQVSQEDAQNALEFLQTSPATPSPSNSEQSNAERPVTEQPVEVTQEDAQNALEYLTGDVSTATNPNAAEDTISIEDLLNAQGVRGTMRTEPGAAPGNTVKDPLEIPADKDGGG